MRDNNKLKAAAVVLVAALAGAGAVTLGTSAPSQGAPEQQMPQAMPISAAAAIEQEVTEFVEYAGRLRAAEDVQVRPRVSGTIESVHFKEGDLVKKGDKLFTIDLRPYKAAFDKADADVAAADAQLQLAVAERKRAKALYDEKAVSRREFDERNNASKAAWAGLKAAKAARDLAALNLEYAEVAAPIDGRVGRPDITVGNMVQAGSSVLTTLQSADPIFADFDMDEQTYLRGMKAVRAGGGSALEVSMALADEEDFARQGRIRSFDNQLSGNSGTLRVRAEFDNTDGILTPGLFARIRLGAAEKRKAVLVNDAAIGTDQDRKFVYVVGADGTVAYRPVVPGGMADGLRIIESGLAGGETVIVNGLMRAHPGMKVQPMPVDMRSLKGPDQPQPQAPQEQ